MKVLSLGIILAGIALYIIVQVTPGDQLFAAGASGIMAGLGITSLFLAPRHQIGDKK